MGIVAEEDKKHHLNPREENIIQLVKLMNLEPTEAFWKRKKEALVISGEIKDGTLTAFSAFEDFGIKIFMPIDYYYLPKRKLEKEDIFIHSLVFSRTKQENLLAAIFYLKHADMDKEKVYSLAKKFNVSEKLYELVRLIDGKPSELGSFDDLAERAKEYGISLESFF